MNNDWLHEGNTWCAVGRVNFHCEHHIPEWNQMITSFWHLVGSQEEFYGHDFWKSAAKARNRDRKAQVTDCVRVDEQHTSGKYSAICNNVFLWCNAFALWQKVRDFLALNKEIQKIAPDKWVWLHTVYDSTAMAMPTVHILAIQRLCQLPWLQYCKQTQQTLKSIFSTFAHGKLKIQCAVLRAYSQASSAALSESCS